MALRSGVEGCRGPDVTWTNREKSTEQSTPIIRQPSERPGLFPYSHSHSPFLVSHGTPVVSFCFARLPNPPKPPLFLRRPCAALCSMGIRGRGIICNKRRQSSKVRPLSR